MDQAAQRCGTTVESAAASYTQLGWSIIPVDGTSKRPLVPSWGVYQTRRANFAEVHEWSRKFQDAGIAVITGNVSSILVLDVDGSEGVDEIELLGYPSTPIALTPRGGAHLYFNMPKGIDFKSSTKVGDSKHFDIRGNNAYVVAPHTVRKDGKKYEWLEHPGKTKLADAPNWLIKLLQKCCLIKPEKIVAGPTKHSQGVIESRLPPYILQLIREGHDLERFPSRSECDFAVILTLLAVGAGVEQIEDIFQSNPIGEKYLEKGRRYIELAIDRASSHVRTVRIQYADPISYDEAASKVPGTRLQLALVYENGDDAGQFFRCGITMPDRNRIDCQKRWNSFFNAVNLPSPDSFQDLVLTSRKLIGKKFRVEMGNQKRYSRNPIAAFYRL